jgi:prepilin-type N-terminal cleavage/methylation domain-containing protein
MRSRSRRAFTLVELLVVIAIIGILVALLLPAVQAAREAARRMQCSNNLKQIALALHNYENSIRELPFGSGYAFTNTGTWMSFILPQLEQQNLYNQFDFRKPMYDPVNKPAITTPISFLTCPSDPQSQKPILKNRMDVGTSGTTVNPAEVFGLWYPGSMGPTHPDRCPHCPNSETGPGDQPRPNNYCCQGNNWGTLAGNGVGQMSSVGMFCRCPKGYTFGEVSDGLSNTFMCGETLPAHCGWNGAYNPNFTVAPTTIPLNTMKSDNGTHDLWWSTSGFKSLHGGGAYLAMGDASIQFINENIDFKLYNNLGTRAGGEPVSLNIR